MGRRAVLSRDVPITPMAFTPITSTDEHCVRVGRVFGFSNNCIVCCQFPLTDNARIQCDSVLSNRVSLF